MWEDPIVAEVHQAREKLAAEFNFDVKAIFADLRKRQTALGDRLIKQKKRVEPAVGANPLGRSESTATTSSEATPAA